METEHTAIPSEELTSGQNKTGQDKTNNDKTIRIVTTYETSKAAALGDISTTSRASIPDPFQVLRETTTPFLYELTDALIYWCQKSLGQKKFTDAHKEFQVLSGTVFYDDSFYHERMGYFLDNIAFESNAFTPKDSDAKNKKHEPTFFEQFLNSGYLEKSGLSESTLDIIKQLKNFQHSLFMIIKSNQKKLLIKDLISNEKIEILGQGADMFRRSRKSTIFQCFVFEIGGIFHLSKGIIVHSSESNKHIQKHIKHSLKLGNFDRAAELFKLGKQNLSYTRIKNMTAESAYKQ